jgi:hypothetical protein
MHLEAVIDRIWRCTWRQRSSEKRAALEGRNRLSLEMHWEAKVEGSHSCLEKISCASQLTIPDRAGTIPDLAGNITDMGSSRPNQACRTPDFS